MSAYTLKKDPTFGDEIYRGEHGAAKIVRNEKDWAIYFFEPNELKSDDKATCKTRKACREWAIAWVTRGYF